MGNLTKDPELRYTPSGKAVANFTLGVNEGKDRPAQFFPVVAWDKQAETIAQYMRKGSSILVSGRLSNRSWEGQDGQKKYITEVVAHGSQFLTALNAKVGENGAAVEPDVAPEFNQ